MAKGRAPNQRLAALLSEAGFTGPQLARAVNAAGAEMGLALRYQRPAVAHWLAGMRPRPPVPDLIAEVFSRELGRQVTVAQTGLAPPGAVDSEPENKTGSAWWRRVDAIDTLQRLGRLARPARTGASPFGVFHLAALSVPPWAVLTATRPTDLPDRTDWQIGTTEVDGARAMLALIADADAAHGGGYVLAALAPYLSTAIAPWLKASVSAPVRTELLAVTARLSYLAGFACFDQCDQPTAQRCYLASAALFAQARDRTGHAIALRALSAQARQLGHRRQAVDLAQAAVDTASRHAPLQTRAFLLGQLAVAHAADGNLPDARASLAAAQTNLHRAQEPPRTIGGWSAADDAYATATVLAFGGDRAGAITALQRSIRRRPDSERRSRAITTARLAELQLDAGHLDAACATWQRFLDDYPHLRSGRADQALAIAKARTRPHQKNPAAARLLKHIQTIETAPT